MSIQGITEHDIAEFLANTPGFFERHAELLAAIQLRSPHGARAVSLQERQMEMMRDKARALEGKIIEMLRHGQENVAIADRLHRWTRALMLTRDTAQLPEVLLEQLRHEFLIPQAGLRLWDVAEEFEALPEAGSVGADAISFARSLSLPYCGANAGFEAVRWLEDPGGVASMAMVPLRRGNGDTFGLLVLASPDPTRYTADMGTEFLMRIGEIASAALGRLLPAA